MKKLAVVLLALGMFSCKQNNTIEITTKDVADDTKVEIMTSELGNPSPTVVYTGTVKGNKLVFENPFTEFEEAYMVLGGEMQNNVFFIGEPGHITISVTKDQPTETVLGGSENNQKLQKLQDEVKPTVTKLRAFIDENQMTLMQLSQSTDEADRAKFEALQNEYKGYIDSINDVYTKHQKDNANNAFGLLLLSQQMMSAQDGETDFVKEFDKFSVELKESKVGKKVDSMLKMMGLTEEAAGLKVGDIAPNFTSKTPEDKELSLEEFKKGKKLVLIDFWASWCGPCRVENPNVVKLYNGFKDKGLDIIGVSLDKEKDKWLQAIEKDGLVWGQVSNLQFWNDEIAAEYGVKAIPANYLINEKGEILAINLYGEELYQKVEELLK
ncbi:AhpC/TSA family protein [Myroides sp. 1354]|uniref:TlpA disulfide reductase family protein n=1 Tax=unclassified Myroides TaxID=2642485 RepID=UPI00257511D8|nr:MULTISPECIES: TlpA disulfide reductase family protein [unclassified Myroides]MDM1045574.1 AhpC/TSA family protein [Myroides sp. R163-1]MDM1056576.1 AhpC/TSA family protein [Myroides sp. 1354]MDM1069704.1 AhpC/TSA family protein [Myroides sp. 1372]